MNEIIRTLSGGDYPHRRPLLQLWAGVVRNRARKERTAFNPDRYQSDGLAGANGDGPVEERRGSQVVAEYGAIRQHERRLTVGRQALLDRVFDGAVGKQ